ncbi:hypothetical protein [Jiangella alkaliphila]|uniref:HTH cro/C1-type domain-containing protein n=1 Tax=Jiangella alkaliphila TaxID=419479 RepID=A0A1H2M348_9ACTN|nr:hypothetical protein [Jiangella alkaliphila]SDU86916.1 hypothetical protein SAMN04488563_6939 [Jiangella alkaliphila]
MQNGQLKATMIERGVTAQALAEKVGVDQKTVQRWVSLGRVPYPRIADEVATMLEVDVKQLWPTLGRGKAAKAALGEVVEVYPHRGSVPHELWARLLSGADESVDLWAWAATFFHQVQPRIGRQLAAAAGRGVRVRLCLGQPAGTAVAGRELEEPLLGPGVLAGKIRTSLKYYRDLVDVDGVEVRLHNAVVYASLFRYDDELIVNPHVFGEPASSNPALHLRRGEDGGIFDAYTSSFETVWTTAASWHGEEV